MTGSGNHILLDEDTIIVAPIQKKCGRGYSQTMLALRHCKPDGNCLFHAINHIFFGGQSDPHALRLEAVNELKAKKNIFPTDEPNLKKYLRDISRNSVHASDYELRPFAHRFDTEVRIMNLFNKGDPYFSVGPVGKEPNSVAFMVHYGDHFDVIAKTSTPETLVGDITRIPIDDPNMDNILCAVYQLMDQVKEKCKDR